jgi:hypothetical protein
MAVVIHGSFDEGPIVLALPPIFEGIVPDGIQAETDPIFNSWNRSDGISIQENQIVDRSNILTTDGSNGTTDIASIIIGNNTGDQDLSGRVPYTGASGNVDLGTNTLDAERVYVNQETPIASTELATKGYVDAQVFESTGEVTPTIAHNDTTGKEGGSGGHWYHLSEAANIVLPNIIQSGSDITPTGLMISGSGISTGRDGLAYVELAWDAIVSDTLDHYVIEYKKSAFNNYTPLSTTATHMIIEGLSPNTSYNFRISSVNRYGTASNFSTDLIYTTPSDGIAPATVTGLTASQAIQAVLLRWTHNTDIDLESYNIYRSLTNNSATSTLVSNFSGNVYMDNGLAANTTYYYWLKAKDTSGNLSTAYSSTVSATTKNVTASDIENIAAGQVIIQGVTTLANWTSPGTTTIDGAKITTGSITLDSINFTGGQAGGGIIARINSSPEGLQIDADNFEISGATKFTSKLGGTYSSSNSLPRIRIFPDVETGMEIVDQYGRFAFRALVGGPNVGDIVIGDWATSGKGIYYDSSASTTTFAGTIFATAGDIGGWTISGTHIGKDGAGPAYSAGMAPLDYPFYAGQTYAYRSSAPFSVDISGYTHVALLELPNVASRYIPFKSGSSAVLVSSIIEQSSDSGNIVIHGGLEVNATTTYPFKIPVFYSYPSTPAPGQIIYYDNGTVGHFYGYTIPAGWVRID